MTCINRLALLTTLMALGLAGMVRAQDADEAPIPGQVDGLAGGPRPEPVDYMHSLEPPKTPDSTTVTTTSTKVLVQEVPTSPTMLPPAQEEPQNTYNGQEKRRIGQLDAMQGRPLNMQYAADLGYLEGYTEGQKKRMAAPQNGQPALPAPGMRQLW